MDDNFYRQVTEQFEMIIKGNEEKEKRASELSIANKELAFQNKGKTILATKLVIANKELIIANKTQRESC